LATRAITIRVEDAVKEQAETILEDIGMNMTTYIVTSLKALVRERKIPFKLVTTQYLTDQIIIDKLTEAEKEEAGPNIKWWRNCDVRNKESRKPNTSKYG